MVNYKKNKNLIFIGAINKNHLPLCGETAKNQVLVEYLENKFKKIQIIDTYNWKKSIKVIYNLFKVIVLKRKWALIISASTNSVYKITLMLNLFRRKNKAYYFVIGNSIIDGIKRGKYKTKYYKCYSNIFVEGKAMENELCSMGLQNVCFVPNFRKIPEHFLRKNHVWPINETKIHFVFLSVIKKEKGVELIFKSIEILNSKGLSERYDVSFYGPIQQEFKETFSYLLNKFNNSYYKGYLNLKEEAGYDILSNYHVMLFPTFWQGEGFPGAIIDAFIAGLPVIATNWHLNSEIITNNFTGFIVKINPIDLSEKMEHFILNKVLIDNMRLNCIKSAVQFDYKHVLSGIEF